MGQGLKVIESEACVGHGEVERRLDALEEWRRDVERDAKEDARENRELLSKVFDKLERVNEKVADVATDVAELAGRADGAAKAAAHTDKRWIALVGAVIAAITLGSNWLFHVLNAAKH